MLKSPPFILNKKRRNAVNDAIEETCFHRKWHLIAKNIRTNHVHLVVNIGDTNPSKALNALKAYATRKLRKRGLWNRQHSPWQGAEARSGCGMTKMLIVQLITFSMVKYPIWIESNHTH